MFKKTYTTAIIASIAIALTQAGCTNNSTENSNKAPISIEEDGIDESKYQEYLSLFPEITPTKIITTSVAIAEILEIIGAPPIGVPSTTTQHLPATLDHTPRIGNPRQPDIEKIVEIQPDLILAPKLSHGPSQDIESALKKANIETIYLPVENMDELKITLKVLGKALNKEEEYQRQLSKMIDSEKELEKISKQNSDNKVLALIGTPESFMVINHKSFLGNMLSKAGVNNIAVSELKAKETYSAMNIENIVAAAPDTVLILKSGNTEQAQEAFNAEVEKNSIWKTLPAYKENRITALDYNSFGYVSISSISSNTKTLAKILKK